MRCRRSKWQMPGCRDAGQAGLVGRVGNEALEYRLRQQCAPFHPLWQDLT